MATTNFTSVDHYLSMQPAESQPVLQQVRDAIRRAVPDAEEVITYQIPTYKIGGTTVIFFAGWKRHYSVYPAGAALVEAFADDLAGYEVNDKGTIRFPLSQPVPVELIERLAEFRVKEVVAERRASGAKRR